MPQKTSFCNIALLKSDLRRYWPMLFLYTGIWLFALPVQLLQVGYYDLALRVESRMHDIFLTNIQAGIIIAMLTGCLVAMAVYSYLMTTRSTGLLHALPLTRTCQFCTHAIAGFGAVTVGNLAIFLLSAAAMASRGVALWEDALLWLAAVELAELFFFALGTLCAMATGWLLAVPVIYAGVNFAVILLWAVLSYMANLFYFGYTSSGVPRVVEYLTPVVRLFEAATSSDSHQITSGMETVYWTDTPEALLTNVCIYAAAGLVLLAAAWYLYQKRPSESAGDAIAFRWLRPVTRWVIGLCGGLGLGIFVHGVVLYNFEGMDSVFRLLVCQIVMGVICFVATQMLLKKSFHVLKKCWKELCVFVVVLCAVTLCVRTDITGYETRIPDSGSVQGVELYSSQISLDTEDPAVIETVIALHRAIVAQGGVASGNVGNSFGDVDVTMPIDYDFNYDYSYCTLRYTLGQQGDTMRRYYNFPVAEGSEIHTLLNELANLTENRADLLNLREDFDVSRIRGGTVSYEEYDADGYYQNYYSGAELSREEAQELYRLAQEDVLHGAAIDVLEDNQWGWKDGSMSKQYYISLDYITATGDHKTFDLSVRAFCTGTLAYLETLDFADAYQNTATYGEDSADYPATEGEIIGCGDSSTTVVITG